MSGGRAKLAVVRTEPDRPEPEEALARLVPLLIDLERAAAKAARDIDIERQRLARKRGVAFIRPEHVRREFNP